MLGVKPTGRVGVPRRCRRAALLWLLLILPALASASAPTVLAIEVVGNTHTQERVVLRELALRPGDAADPQRIAASRQAVEDLGLFREVRIDSLVEPGGVRLLVRVREKRYLLPIPRVDASSDRDRSHGAQLRWSNVGGRGDRLVAFVEETRFRAERDKERARTARISYQAPYLGDGPWGWSMFADREERRSLDRAGRSFEETFTRHQWLISHDLRDSRPRRGWVLGGGVYWHQQEARGPFAPPSDGRALALVGLARYSDLRSSLYSDSGRVFVARAETAFDGLGSDYAYQRLLLSYREQQDLGSVAHQQLHWQVQAGWTGQGPGSRNDYALGGSRRLRGYPVDFAEGRRFWHLSGEYLRPLGRDWLRLLLLAEAGQVGGDLFDEGRDKVYASLGLGIRARLTWFVDVEFEAGIALPLIDGRGSRFFASGL